MPQIFDNIDQSLLPAFQSALRLLAKEDSAGLFNFHISGEFQEHLLEFQKSAVQIAAHQNKRNGDLVGDVARLGKTLMVTALARIPKDGYSMHLLILCHKNLVKNQAERS